MKIVFLGTGTSTGVPMIGCHCEVCASTDKRDYRSRTSIFIEINGKKIVVDTGPDFRTQLLLNKIEDVDAILFTHNHKDHTSGLDDIRPINYLKNKHIDIFAESYVQDSLKREYAYIFHEKDYPGIPLIRLHTITDATFCIDDIEIIPIRVWHKNLPVLGFRIGGFTYITDANFIDESNLEKIAGSEILVINGLQRTPHYSHFTLDEALEIIAGLKPAKAYITHISHKLGLHADVENSLPENVFLAHDGLVLEL